MLVLLSAALAAPVTALYDLGFVLEGEGEYAGGVGAPAVDWDGANGRYLMYFESPVAAADTPEDCAQAYQLGRATSPDGVHWTVEATAGLGPAWDDPTSPRHCSTAQPALVYDGQQWNLFWSAATTMREGGSSNTPAGIGWATSPDGESWTVQDELVAEYDGRSLGMGSAVVVDGTLHLAYLHTPDIELIHRAVSGGSWSEPVVVLDHAAVGDWAADTVLAPSLSCDPDAAAPFGLLFGGDADGVRSLGYATSADGVSWTPPAAPLSGGTLDYAGLNHWDLLGAGSGWAVWTSATDPDSGLKAIGVAVSDTQLGAPRPRACPDPWATADDTGDTGDTGDTDTDTDTDDADHGDDTGGDTGDDCGCASPRAPASALALGLALAAVRRRSAGNRTAPRAQRPPRG